MTTPINKYTKREIGKYPIFTFKGLPPKKCQNYSMFNAKTKERNKIVIFRNTIISNIGLLHLPTQWEISTIKLKIYIPTPNRNKWLGKSDPMNRCNGVCDALQIPTSTTHLSSALKKQLYHDVNIYIYPNDINIDGGVEIIVDSSISNPYYTLELKGYKYTKI